MRINRIKLTVELTKRDMTQQRLAELSGVSRTTINYLKCGKSCSYDTAEKIARALDIPVQELIEN